MSPQIVSLIGILKQEPYKPFAGKRAIRLSRMDPSTDHDEVLIDLPMLLAMGMGTGVCNRKDVNWIVLQGLCEAFYLDERGVVSL